MLFGGFIKAMRKKASPIIKLLWQALYIGDDDANDDDANDDDDDSDSKISNKMDFFNESCAQNMMENDFM